MAYSKFYIFLCITRPSFSCCFLTLLPFTQSADDSSCLFIVLLKKAYFLVMNLHHSLTIIIHSVQLSCNLSRIVKTIFSFHFYNLLSTLYHHVYLRNP